MIKEFLNDYHIKARALHKGSMKVRFSPFEPMQQRDKDWMLGFYAQLVKSIVDGAIDKRKDKLKKDEESVRKQLTDGEYFFAKDAHELGLIDHVTTPDEYFQTIFKGEKVRIGSPELPFFEKLSMAAFYSQFEDF